MTEKISYELNSPSFVYNTIKGQGIIINFDMGIYYSLNQVGTIVLNSILNNQSENLILDFFKNKDLIHVSSEELRNDINSFIEQLLKEKILLKSNSNKSMQKFLFELETPLVEYSTPRLEKFTDMEDFFKLDPISDF